MNRRAEDGPLVHLRLQLEGFQHKEQRAAVAQQLLHAGDLRRTFAEPRHLGSIVLPFGETRSQHLASALQHRPRRQAADAVQHL